MYALFIPLKNVCANSKIDSILKFVCVMLTYPFLNIVGCSVKVKISSFRCESDELCDVLVVDGTISIVGYGVNPGGGPSATTGTICNHDNSESKQSKFISLVVGESSSLLNIISIKFYVSS